MFAIARSFLTASSSLSRRLTIYLYTYVSNQTLNPLFLSKSPDLPSSIYRLCPTRKELQYSERPSVHLTHDFSRTSHSCAGNETRMHFVFTTSFQTVVSGREKETQIELYLRFVSLHFHPLGSLTCARAAHRSRILHCTP